LIYLKTFKTSRMKNLILLLFAVATAPLHAQETGYWQQRADYAMNVHVDVKTYKFKGDQKLVYQNNSNDTLRKVYYHLYFNAFQPGSEMDARLSSIGDPDAR